MPGRISELPAREKQIPRCRIGIVGHSFPYPSLRSLRTIVVDVVGPDRLLQGDVVMRDWLNPRLRQQLMPHGGYTQASARHSSQLEVGKRARLLRSRASTTLPSEDKIHLSAGLHPVRRESRMC